MAKRDYYEVLGVAKTATADEIKKAYRKIAMANHPDTHPNDKEAEERFKEASEAYEVLSDSTKKANYDQYGFAGVDGMAGGAAGGYQNVYRDFSDIFGGGASFEDLFGSFFSGGSSSRRNPNGPMQGRSYQMEVILDFKEAAFGVKKEISFAHEELCDECHGAGGTGKKTCPTCGGSGRISSGSGFFSMQTRCSTCGGKGTIVEKPCRKCKGTGTVRKQEKVSVTIPPGSDNGTRLTLRGKGDAGENGGSAGDVFLIIRVREDKYFVRDGADVYLQLPISMTQAALGASIVVTTVDGSNVRVDIPAGTQTGKLLRLRGKGIPVFQSTGYGDMYLRIIVETPKKLSSKAKKLMQELNDEMKPTDKPEPVRFER